MTRFEQNIQETAQVLSISFKDAMVLEFVNMGAWGNIAKSNKAEAIAFIGGKHAKGDIDGATKDQLMAMVA